MLSEPTDNPSVTNADSLAAGSAVGPDRDGRPTGHAGMWRAQAEVSRDAAWLWWPRVPLGAITLLSGDPGVGKSYLTLDIAARVSSGSAWPDGGSAQRGSAVLLSAEDNLRTIRPRLQALGADLGNLLALDYVGCQAFRSFDLAHNLDDLVKTVDAAGDCRLVVIDPVTSYLGGTSENANTQVRRLLEPVADLAASRRLAVVLVSHLRKRPGRALYQTLGCQAFVAMARAKWIVRYDTSDSERRIFFSPKSNLGPDVGGLAFRIEKVSPSGSALIRWEPDAVRVTVDSSEIDQRSAHRVAYRRQEASEWLFRFLTDRREAPANEIYGVGDSYGFSYSTLRRAADDLNVQKIKTRGTKHGCWVWRLPG